MSERRLFIGCAGWTIPATEHSVFPEAGSHLQRYAALFAAVEINSSFYRSHRATTYARWAGSVPDDFRFSVKIPKAITHTARLANVESPLAQFVEECSHLGDKLGCLLVQLPPSLKFSTDVASTFFRALRGLTEADVSCEPRHPSWISEEANSVLERYRVARVIADPSPFPSAELSPIHNALVYYRLHGSPKMYYSSYGEPYLEQLAFNLQRDLGAVRTCWCIFDNTAEGAAIRNALELSRRIRVN